MFKYLSGYACVYGMLTVKKNLSIFLIIFCILFFKVKLLEEFANLATVLLAQLGL